MVNFDLTSEVARLAALPPLEYDVIRKDEARKLGVKASTLDKEVAAARPAGQRKTMQGRPLHIAAPEPWHDEVAGAEILDALSAFFARHATLPPHGANCLALWTLHTHCFESGRHTPRLAITSIEKGCGKTTVLDLLELTCNRPLAATNLTAAAIFRTIEIAKPTLLVDEADLFLAEAQDVRAVLNAGNKRSGQVVRCVGDDAEPRAFAVHAPVAVAAIGRLPDTLTDRSIRLAMRRALATDQPARISPAVENEGAILARKAARWAADEAGTLADEPPMPDALANRAADNWRILFAIAERAGGDWPARTQAAALAAGDGDATESLGVALLRDLRTIYANETKLETAELVRRLVAMDDRPWPEMPGTGKPMTATWFTRRVKRYGAKRKQLRAGDDRGWGFERGSFEDAFARYLPPADQAPAHETGDVVTLLPESKNLPNVKLVASDLSPVASGDAETCHHFDLPETLTKSNGSPRHQFPGGISREWVGEL